MKYPIDVDRLLHIVKFHGGDPPTLEVAAALCALMNRAYEQGLKDGKVVQR